MGKSFLLKDRLFSVTLVGIYNYYGTWIIWAVPYEDWLPFMGCVWEQQRTPCCSKWCRHPQTVKHSKLQKCNCHVTCSSVWVMVPAHPALKAREWFSLFLTTGFTQMGENKLDCKYLKLNFELSLTTAERKRHPTTSTSAFSGEKGLYCCSLLSIWNCRPIIRWLQQIGYCTPTVITRGVPVGFSWRPLSPSNFCPLWHVFQLCHWSWQDMEEHTSAWPEAESFYRISCSKAGKSAKL